MVERGVVFIYVWQTICVKDSRWVLRLASTRWWLYPYSKILIHVLLARMSSHNCASRFHRILSTPSILRCLASTSKENTKQRMQNRHNQSKKENGPRWVGPDLLVNLNLRLSLLCQYEVRLNGRKSIQQGVAPMGWLGWCGYLVKTRPHYYLSLLCEPERKPDHRS